MTPPPAPRLPMSSTSCGVTVVVRMGRTLSDLHQGSLGGQARGLLLLKPGGRGAAREGGGGTRDSATNAHRQGGRVSTRYFTLLTGVWAGERG